MAARKRNRPSRARIPESEWRDLGYRSKQQYVANTYFKDRFGIRHNLRSTGAFSAKMNRDYANYLIHSEGLPIESYEQPLPLDARFVLPFRKLANPVSSHAGTGPSRVKGRKRIRALADFFEATDSMPDGYADADDFYQAYKDSE